MYYWYSNFRRDDSDSDSEKESELKRGSKVARTRLDDMLDNPDVFEEKKEKKKDDEEEYRVHLGRRAKTAAAEGMCVECEDVPATILCEQCQDIYCSLCFQAQHKKGKRTEHAKKSLLAAPEPPQPQPSAAKPSKKTETGAAEDGESMEISSPISSPATVPPSLPSESGAAPNTAILERAKFIPVRLVHEERKYLRLIEAALKVSEYTDKVDILSYVSKTKRIHTQIREICAILSGLVVACDYQLGQQLLKDRNFKDNEAFFQKVFELGRRHKIMNPEKMRSEYGKLVYLLMDSQIPQVKELLEFNCVAPIKTVYSFLEQRGALGVLTDEFIETATREIVAAPRTPRHVIQKEIKTKERAQEHIAREYANAHITPDEIKWCLYSISDNNAFLRCNRDPVDKMIKFLTHYFRPDSYDEGFSLSIQAGQGGARISHDHESQFYYALQSMMLWREVLHDMFRLWCIAEEDLLSENNPYRLMDTGQGLNRVQAAPRVYREMQRIVSRVQARVGHWVGSSVIHLGDHNVPNALMFIDKYCQVPRILGPIVLCIEQIDEIIDDDEIKEYIDSAFGGPENLKRQILCDFFRHAFDGSGADNFFDAGSCIDGRLTSAWNWCSKLEKKPFFPVFLLTGFIGFDGDFQN